MGTKTVIIFALIAIFGFIVFTYNRLIALIEAVRNNQKQIDIQLDRRFKVFESLINVVKKYMDYEQTTLKDVVKLRSQAEQAKAAGDEKSRIAAENGISTIAGKLSVVFEQYPELKASQNCIQLQEEIVSTENRLAFAKQSYNDSVENYNATKKSFFTSQITGLFRAKLDFNFLYWQLDEAKIAEQENYTVKL